MRPNPKPTPEEFLKRVVVTTSDLCWPWRFGKTKDGYGNMKVMGKEVRAHRLSYELFIGPIPEGLNVLHHCDNPPCCNPAHLFVGTQKDNMIDCRDKGRLNSAVGEKIKNSRLTTHEVLEIRALATAGHSLTNIARRYKVSIMCIFCVVHRVTWKHVKPPIEEQMLEYQQNAVNLLKKAMEK